MKLLLLLFFISGHLSAATIPRPSITQMKQILTDIVSEIDQLEEKAEDEQFINAKETLRELSRNFFYDRNQSSELLGRNMSFSVYLSNLWALLEQAHQHRKASELDQAGIVSQSARNKQEEWTNYLYPFSYFENQLKKGNHEELLTKLRTFRKWASVFAFQ